MKFKIKITVFIYSILLSCNSIQDSDNAKNKDAIKSTISSYIISQNSIGKNRVDTLLTEKFVRNMNGFEMVSNINEHKANMNVFLTGFPNMSLTFKPALIKENEAYLEWTFSGTNTGEYGELSATGKKVKVKGISHLYLNEHAKIYREDVFYNELGLLQQLGYKLIPPLID